MLSSEKYFSTTSAGECEIELVCAYPLTDESASQMSRKHHAHDAAKPRALIGLRHLVQFHEIRPAGLTDSGPGQNDDTFPGLHQRLGFQPAFGLPHSFIGCRDLRHRVGKDAPVQGHLPTNRLEWSKGDNLRHGALLRHEPGRRSSFR